MIPGLEALACQDLAVPITVMEHVVSVESSFNPYAIGVVGARLARQPRSLEEAVATAKHLEREGYNFSLGLAQVNRHNLAKQGLDSYEKAFTACPNLAAGARILADCHARAGGDWGKAFSCYYSGNFVRGFRDGYVQKVQGSMQRAGVLPATESPPATPLARRRPVDARGAGVASLRERRAMPAALAATQVQVATDAVVPAETVFLPPVPTPSTQPFVPHVTGPRPAPPAASTDDPEGPGPGRDAAFVF
ncbi:hypothetical protein GCM10007164_14860 [Luteimonas padinae]|uniref:Transglycosylase SLT domain-containing protein n=1 Tax=Luteimonas padinae TaxID=1714359 RepID=A0ABV6SUX5_9GAMM|nr:lytic transglycosylase domain-containing protein [Luteimonas padinae]GHD70287.1 hypothetical protein GCM10007164_14860 [Luteimonas padinae]